MYNGEKIRSLLYEQGKKPTDLAEYVFKNGHRAITPLITGNPTAETLENVADFFKVSTEVFFKRQVLLENGESDSSAQIPYIDLIVSAKDELNKTLKEQNTLLTKEKKNLQRENKELKQQLEDAKKLIENLRKS
ncbi:MAG: hypothetical protein MJZ82_01980 [Paludibacteraceae bacterium]|nr:hypothetical protein [Paludibacteraceae bacterium]